MSIVQDKYRGTTEYVHVLAELVRAAQYSGLTTYQDVAAIMGLPMQGNLMGRELGQMLGEIAEDEARSGRPMLTAVVVGTNGKPGPGFFSLARELGKLKEGDDEQSFWQQERQAAYAAWRRPLPRQ